jgi:hypothetical protein
VLVFRNLTSGTGKTTPAEFVAAFAEAGHEPRHSTKAEATRVDAGRLERSVVANGDGTAVSEPNQLRWRSLRLRHRAAQRGHHHRDDARRSRRPA